VRLKREGRAAGRHHKQHGRAQRHRAWQGQRGFVGELQPLRRPRKEPWTAKRRFTLTDHRAATLGVERRKDKEVIDETPSA
jgi:hypothetical protein